MPTLQKHDPIVNINCIRGNVIQTKLLAMVYLRRGCITLQHWQHYSEGCIINVRTRNGESNIDLHLISNFLKYKTSSRDTDPATIPALQSIYVIGENFILQRNHRNSKSSKMTVDSNTYFVIKMFNNYLLASGFSDSLPNVVYQAHFKITFQFHYQTYVHSRGYSEAFASIIPTGYVAVPTEKRSLRQLDINIDEICIGKWSSTNVKRWEHMVSYMYIHKSEKCRNTKEYFNISIKYHSIDNSSHVHAFRMILVNEISMNQSPVLITSYHLSHDIQFKVVIQCGIHIDYQMLISQTPLVIPPEDDCFYRVCTICNMSVEVDGNSLIVLKVFYIKFTIFIFKTYFYFMHGITDIWVY